MGVMSAVDYVSKEKLSETSPPAICHPHPIHVCLVALGAGMLLTLRTRVPIYSAASYASLMSQTAAFYLDPLRDIYEVGDPLISPENPADC